MENSQITEKKYIVIKKTKYLFNQMFDVHLVPGEKILLRSNEGIIEFKRDADYTHFEWIPFPEGLLTNIIEISPLICSELIRRGHFMNWIAEKNAPEIDNHGKAVDEPHRISKPYPDERTAIMFLMEELKMNSTELCKLLF